MAREVWRVGAGPYSEESRLTVSEADVSHDKQEKVRLSSHLILVRTFNGEKAHIT